MKWGSLLSFTVLAPFAHALLRFPCAQLVTERLDPLVTPGQVSPHVHQIIGGNAFNITMDHSKDLGTASTCTTCRFRENRSNYWTAVLYFKAGNGSFIRVPQMANQFTGSPNGGMTVYYIQPIGSNEKVTAFPKGFRMIVGNPMLRARKSQATNDIDARAISFRCFGANFQSDSSYPHPGTGSRDTVNLPTGQCAGGIRSNIFFPSCWNGRDIDPEDHASHMAYPTGTIGRDGLFFHVGSCPASHPTRMPLLFFEIVWDTRQFSSQWPTDGSQPFIFSMGDPTGYGQHADYVFGWQGDALQRAMDQCTDIGGDPNSCRALTINNDAEMNRCTIDSVVNERVEGTYINALPGCNPVQSGPGPATMVPNCNALSTTGIGGPVVTNPPVTSQPPVVNPPVTGAPGPLQTRFGQCGGSGWTGPSQCQSPYACTATNQWYSQCL